MFAKRRAAAYRAYYEFMPLRNASHPQGSGMQPARWSRGAATADRCHRTTVLSCHGGETETVQTSLGQTERFLMKIVVIGGTGLIGSKVVTKLREHRHDAVAASPQTGVNTLTGDGLAEALEGAEVVVDVSNSPSFEDAAVLEFFQTATVNLLAAEKAAGVGHHVALSVVGTERMADKGYFLAKSAQEKLIEGSSVPYSIVHATQFFEFLESIAALATDGDTVRLPPVLFQPMAAEDVATAVARISVGSPVNGIAEVGGPDKFRMDELVRQALKARNDPRQVVSDPEALYFGAYAVDDSTLVPADGALVGEIRFGDWLERQPAAA